MSVCRHVHRQPTVIAHKEISYGSTNKGGIHRALFQDKYLTFETNLSEVNVLILAHSQAYALTTCLMVLLNDGVIIAYPLQSTHLFGEEIHCRWGRSEVKRKITLGNGIGFLVGTTWDLAYFSCQRDCLSKSARWVYQCPDSSKWQWDIDIFLSWKYWYVWWTSDNTFARDRLGRRMHGFCADELM